MTTAAKGVNISALEDPELQNIDEKGVPPTPSRLTDANAMRSYFGKLMRLDEGSAMARAKVQAMKDGRPPFEPASLRAAGQASRANANFLQALHLLNKTCNGYNDIIFSVKDLVQVQTAFGEDAERVRNNRIIAQEVTRTFRRWSSFQPNFLSLVNKFVTHGVCAATFPDPRDFRFEVSGLGEFIFDRQVKASEEKIPIAMSRQDMTVTDLYAMIRDRAKAESLGWDYDATVAAIHRATNRSNTGQNVGQWERFQEEVKNNDLFAGQKYPHIPLIHAWVREFDGTVSFVIAEKDGDSGFLFTHRSRYQSVDEAFVLFTYGVGEGTYHSIRGLGHMIYPLVQLLNRIMCHLADSALIAGSIMVQPESQKALDEMQIQPLGPYTVISPGVQYIERGVPDLTRAAIPVFNEIKESTSNYVSQFSAPSVPNGVYENRLSTEAQMESLASGDAGAIDLFYSALDRLFREMVRRLTNGKKSDPLAREFLRRCEERGVTKEVLTSLDHASTYATRAIGAGSSAARGLGLNRLLQLLPNLDEIGQKRLIYQFVAEIVGYQNADYYAAEPEEPRLDVEAKVAEMENILLLQGNPIGVNPQEMHATHAIIHITPLGELLEAIERGQTDPMEMLPGLRAMLQHLAMHAEPLAQDPAQRPIYGAVKLAVNNVTQVVDNFERKIRAEERRVAEEGGAIDEGTGQPLDPETEAKARVAQLRVMQEEFKFQLAQQLGQLKIAEQQAKQQQALAINDLRAAQMAQKAVAFPALSYQNRR
jgi:hypothetical protein